jgi:hypothetical protein
MKFLRTSFSACILLLSIVQFTNAQINYSWVGGTSSSWNETSNWSPAAVPGVNDTALITMDGEYSVVLDVDATVSKIVLGGSTGSQTLSLSNSTLTINGDFEVGANGVLSVTNSTISGTGSILNSGSLESTQGIINTGLENYGLSTFTGTNELTDTIITHLNSTFNIVSGGGPIDFRSDKGFENNGLLQSLTYNYWAGGSLEVTNGSLVNNADGVLNILVPGTISSSASPFNLVVQLENHGEVLVDHWTVLQKSDAAHINSGELSLQDNVLTITQVGTTTSFSNSGTISVDETSTLNIQGGTVDFISGSLDVQGLLDISSSTVNIIPDYTNSIPLSITGSTLNCSASFSNQEKLSIFNTVVNGSNSFTNQDTLLATGTEFNMDFVNEGVAIFSGITDMNDTIITQPNSTLQIASYSNIPMQFTSASGFTNHGVLQSLTYNYWAGGHITITDGELVNDAQGLIEISAPGTLSSSASVLRLLMQLDNQGEVVIDHNTNLDRTSAIHTNSGTLRVTDHFFSIIQTGTSPAFINTGEFNIDNNSIFTVNGGDFDYNSGTFDPEGSFSAVNATVNFIPAYTNTGSITLNASVLNCSAAFTNQSDLEIINTTINGDNVFLNQDTMSANSIIFNMDFNNQGLASFTGSIAINDTLITNPNSTLDILSSAYMDFTSAKGISNNGLLQLITRNYWGGGTVEVVNGSLTNNEGGILNVLVQGTLSSSSSPLTLDFHLVNNGDLLVDHNSILSRASVIHENSGKFTIRDHTLTINQAGTSFINQATGSIYGTGTLIVNDISFTNSGAINPGLSPGLLTVNGDITQDPGSILNIELGGITVGTLYDQLNVSGSYGIDGQLNVELVDDFNPTAGDIFEVARFTSSTGDFDEINVPYPGTGVIFNVEQNPTNINVITLAYSNNAPFVERQIADLDVDEDFGSMELADLDTIFNDPDISLGDKLDYSYELSDNVLEASITDNVLSLASIADLNGVSSLVITAMDAGMAIARDTVNIQVTAVNDAPGSFSLHSPSDGVTIPDTVDLIFTWDKAIDADGDIVEYTLNLSTTAWDSVITEITDTVLIFSDLSALAADETYEWSVSASDGQVATACLKDFTFTTPMATSTDPRFADGGFHLRQNYPNPFREFTYIDFSLPGSNLVSVQIFDLHGGLIRTVTAGQLPAGDHTLRLDLYDLASGVYFYRLNAGSNFIIKKMTKIQ